MESDGISSQPVSESDSTPLESNGAALLLVIGEPASEDHKTLILSDITKGFKCWQKEDVDINEELAHIANKADIGEEGPNGERILQNRLSGLAVEILVNPQLQTLKQAIKKFISSGSTYKHLIYAGHCFSGNGAWVLQDDTFTLSHLSQILKDNTVEDALKLQKGSQLVVHCSAEGEWKQANLQKLPGFKELDLQLNPTEKLSSSHGVLQFVAYISNFVKPMSMTDLLKTTDYVGNLRFSKPTLYIFPGCEGDSALFVISGFNLLVNGGYRRKSCFWDFSRHLDRIDAVLLTHLGSDNLFGVSSMLQRKSLGNVHPEIGYIYMNTADKLPQVNGDKKPSLKINLAEEGSKIVEMTKQIGHTPHPCVRPTTGNQLQPINLYHKVGHGSLDMYVLNPVSDSKELKEFYQQWNKQVAEFGVAQSISLPSMLSICAMLVWQPADPNEKINRMFFPGNAPQHKIVEGLEKLKHLDFLKHPSCSAKDLQSKGPVKKATGATRPASGRTVKTTSVEASVKKTESSKVTTTERKEPHRPKSDVSKSADLTKGRNGTSKTSEAKSKPSTPRSAAPKTNKLSKEEENKRTSKTEEKPKAKATSPTKPSPKKPLNSTPKKSPTDVSAQKVQPEKVKPVPEAEIVKMVEEAPKPPLDTKSEDAEPQVAAPAMQESLIDIAAEEPSIPPTEPVPEKTPSPGPLPDPNQFDAAPAQTENHDLMSDSFMLGSKQEEQPPQQHQHQAFDDFMLPNVGQQTNQIEDMEEHEEQELVQPESLPEPVAYSPQEPDLIPDSFPSKEIPSSPEPSPTAGLILPEPDVVPSSKSESEFKMPEIGEKAILEQDLEEVPVNVQETQEVPEVDKNGIGINMSEHHEMTDSFTDELEAKSTEEVESPEQVPSPEFMKEDSPILEERDTEHEHSESVTDTLDTAPVKEVETSDKAPTPELQEEDSLVHEDQETDLMRQEHQDIYEQEHVEADKPFEQVPEKETYEQKEEAVEEELPEEYLDHQSTEEHGQSVGYEGELESQTDTLDQSPCSDEDISEKLNLDVERAEQQELAEREIEEQAVTTEGGISPQMDEKQFPEFTPEQDIVEESMPPSQQETVSPVPSPVEPATKIDALDINPDEDEGEISPDEADSQGNAGDISPDFDSQGSQEGSPVTEHPIDDEDVSPYAFENKGFAGTSQEEIIDAAGSEMVETKSSDAQATEDVPEDACVDAFEKDAVGQKESPILEDIPTIHSPDAAAGSDLAAEADEEPVRSKDAEEKDDDHLEMSNIPEAFEKDITPDPLDQVPAKEESVSPPPVHEDSDEGIHDDMPEPSPQTEHQDLPEDYEQDEKEDSDDMDIKQQEGLNPFDGLDQARIANAQEPFFSPDSENSPSEDQGFGAHREAQDFGAHKEPINQEHDPFGFGIQSQDSLPANAAAAAGNTASSQQAYRDPFDEFVHDDADREMAQQQFDPESHWGQPMGLPSPPPPEEKAPAANGPVKGSTVSNGKGVANGKTTPSKSAAKSTKPGDSKRPDSATVTKTKSSDKSSVQKSHTSKTVTEKKKLGTTEKLNTSRSESSRTEKHNTSKVETTKMMTGKGRPASAAVSEPKAKPTSRRPATATGSSRSSPAPAKMPSLPPMTPFYVDLTYIPHHGNTAVCDVEFFKRIRARYYVYSSLSPNPQTLNALLDGKQTWEDKDLKVTIIPTYDNDTLHHWMALNKDRLNELKVEVDPSASRCTVQLQDHETCCLAYRLEFFNHETL